MRERFCCAGLGAGSAARAAEREPAGEVDPIYELMRIVGAQGKEPSPTPSERAAVPEGTQGLLNFHPGGVRGS
jgi:hypothetical protein